MEAALSWLFYPTGRNLTVKLNNVFFIYRHWLIHFGIILETSSSYTEDMH